jgi:hypothetical protein
MGLSTLGQKRLPVERIVLASAFDRFAVSGFPHHSQPSQRKKKEAKKKETLLLLLITIHVFTL